jgi:hypothetical protein
MRGRELVRTKLIKSKRLMLDSKRPSGENSSYRGEAR